MQMPQNIAMKNTSKSKYESIFQLNFKEFV